VFLFRPWTGSIQPGRVMIQETRKITEISYSWFSRNSTIIPVQPFVRIRSARASTTSLLRHVRFGIEARHYLPYSSMNSGTGASAPPWCDPRRNRSSRHDSQAPVATGCSSHPSATACASCSASQVASELPHARSAPPLFEYIWSDSFVDKQARSSVLPARIAWPVPRCSRILRNT
jgi:hypothetical protein